MQAVFFEGSRETGTSRRSDACLTAVETLSKQLVGVCPMVIAVFIVQVFSDAGVRLFANDFSDHGVLHCDAGEFADVIAGGLVILMR